jgi:hypothetical protein
MKRILLTALALLTLGTAFAQMKFPLFINCSEMGADVYINNKLYTKTVQNLTIQLPPAVYQITIAKAGFNEFRANVNVQASSRNNVLSVQMQPVQAPAQLPAPRLLVPTFVLNVASNVAGATVFLGAQPSGQTPLGLNLPRGRYDIRVTAPGYTDFVQQVDLSGPMTVNAILQGSSQTLSVNATNIAGADVYINGNLAGRTPFQAQVPSGSYQVVIKAGGFFDYAQNVVVGASSVQVNAALQPQAFQVAINSNVQGALVFLNGNQAGQTPFAAALPPGSYNLVVRAIGYLDYQAQIVVTGPAAVNALLQSAMAGWQLVLPEFRFAPGEGEKLDARGLRPRLVRVWMDGEEQRDLPGPVAASGQVAPGKHKLRLEFAGFVTELQFDAAAGGSYTLEPSLGLRVR